MEASHRNGISLVIPAYNEEATIETAISESYDALLATGRPFEIVVVDDGSRDQTNDKVRDLCHHVSGLRLVEHETNHGYGAALKSGFAAAKMGLVGFTDADCQFDLQEISRFLVLIEDYPIVCGYRICRKDPWRRRFYSGVYNLLTQTLLGTAVRDCDCAFKLFQRDALGQLDVDANGFLVNAELLTAARQRDLSIVEVGVSHRQRLAGCSKVSVMHALPVLLQLIRFWWTTVMFPARQSPLSRSSHASPFTTLCLALVAGVLLFARLNYPLLEPDETRYAQISLEMAESGEFIVPTLHGQPYLDKPPMLYWATATSYVFFGVSPVSARLPCALAAWLTVLLTYVFGARFIGERASLVASILLLMCSGFVLCGRFLIMDGLLTLFATLASLAACRALHATRGCSVWWALCGMLCGAGMLTKGPVALVICLPPALAVGFVSRLPGRVSIQRGLVLVASIALIAAPWYLLIAAQQSEFVGYFFWKHNVVRFVSAFDHQQPWWFYLVVVAAGMFPTSALIPSLVVFLASKGKLRHHRTSQFGFLLIVAVWTITFFSLSSCKLPTYILPAIPMLCLALGKMLADVWWPSIIQSASELSEQLKCSVSTSIRLATVVVLLAAPIAALANWLLNGPKPQDQLLLIVFVAVPVPLLWYLMRSELVRRAQLVVTANVCLVVGAFIFLNVIPEFAKWRSSLIHAAAVKREIGGDPPIVFYGRHRDWAGFRIESGPVVEFKPDEIDELQDYVERRKLSVIVGSGKAIAKLRAANPRITLEPWRSRTSRRHIYLARPMPGMQR